MKQWINRGYPGNDVLLIVTAPDPIHQLLDHLVNTREMDLYYYLMNDAAIVNFSDSSLEIVNLSSNKQYNIRLESILGNIFGAGYKIVVVENDNDFPSLKTTLSDKFKQSPTWQYLRKQFPDAKLEDMLHAGWKR